MITTVKFLTTLACCLTLMQIRAQPTPDQLDVESYHVQLEPDILGKSLVGNVQVVFSTRTPGSEVILNCGSLTVEEVRGVSVEGFQQAGGELTIRMRDTTQATHTVDIFYHGTPTRGVQFITEKEQMYTVFSTSEWMVCHMPPHDRARIRLDLRIPDHLSSIASGMRGDTKQLPGGKALHSWVQEVATPAYTYGFAIGSFDTAEEQLPGRSLHYYSDAHRSEALDTIFEHTADMLLFFEEKSGVPYFQESYTQILMGTHYQEMSGFAVLRESYGNMVLADHTETNLIGHELAHQWWGNMITCESWQHFWLNEGFATFMSAAYNEHRFGPEKYQVNINAYHDVYQKLKQKGADKPLIFDDWSNPSADDRNIVYFKGAYVLHLLRAELGEAIFWEGLKAYSQQYYGKSVNTKNFQSAMEQAAGRNLQDFFGQWVY